MQFPWSTFNTGSKLAAHMPHLIFIFEIFWWRQKQARTSTPTDIFQQGMKCSATCGDTGYLPHAGKTSAGCAVMEDVCHPSGSAVTHLDQWNGASAGSSWHKYCGSCAWKGLSVRWWETAQHRTVGQGTVKGRTCDAACSFGFVFGLLTQHKAQLLKAGYPEHWGFPSRVQSLTSGRKKHPLRNNSWGSFN